jgi:hypothetical protein
MRVFVVIGKATESYGEHVYLVGASEDFNAAVALGEGFVASKPHGNPEDSYRYSYSYEVYARSTEGAVPARKIGGYSE